MDALLSLEQLVIDRLQWPSWALRLNLGLTIIVLLTWLIQQLFTFDAKPSENKSTNAKSTWEFRGFQLSYLTVYLITMLADWLQGTHMYTLYSSYGMRVGTLFLTGFASSALFGTFLGIYVDKWGRKFGCILFCLLEIVINVLEHVPSMPILLIGRVLGGLSTSLLFTAFESWMVSEHRRRGFHEDLLASTFSIASAGNGLAAIAAGFFAQLAADASGDIGPFQLAILLTVITLFMILFWRENYGNNNNNNNNSNTDPSKGGEGTGGGEASLSKTLVFIRDYPAIWMLGLSQACFEGAVFTFVFMWVPTLLALQIEGQEYHLPTGLVFSSFMLAMTFGGMLFALLLPIFPGGAEGLCCIVFIMAAISMAVPIFAYDFWSVLISFLILEAMVGMFNSCGGTLRSKYYPEQIQSSVMSIFRLPLNLLVVMGTMMADHATDVESRKFVFSVISMILAISAVLQLALSLTMMIRKEDSSKKSKRE